MKKYFFFFILIYLFIAPCVYGAEVTNTGFIPGQIWYSKDSLLEGETVKIYTALWNSGNSPLSAKVEFYDKNVILGTRDIVIPALQVKEVSVSWKVTSGDHSISAKIISPSITTGGKKEMITLENISTETSRKFVPVAINTIEGKPATSADIIKSQIDKATSSLDNILPASISNPVTENVSAIDDFRVDTFKDITKTKIETEKRIDEIKKAEALSLKNEKAGKVQSKVGIDTATDKPIAYLKLIFLSILSFVFSSKIVFYAIIVFVVFLILRYIYRKIRNR